VDRAARNGDAVSKLIDEVIEAGAL
jgi:hypothetical protein